jgi:hypothetical protein
MIIARRYITERADDTNTWRVKNLDAPFCPSCGSLCSGYDTRARSVAGEDGNVMLFRLRRLLCPVCGKLHTEVPAFMRPRKRYTAEVIDAVIDGRGESCPADERTMRRWRRENHPPEMSGLSQETVINLSHNVKKGAET